MFDLDQAVATWRRQTEGAGLDSPELLDELESHLREEIQKLIKLGMMEPAAFALAVDQIGEANLLRREFARATGFSGWLSRHKNHLLGAFWLVFCFGGFLKLAAPLSSIGYSFADFRPTPDFLLALLMVYVYLRGTIGSVLLFGGSLRERRFLRFLAALDAVGGVAAIATWHFTWLTVIFTPLGMVSIWLLRPPQKLKPLTE